MQTGKATASHQVCRVVLSHSDLKVGLFPVKKKGSEVAQWMENPGSVLTCISLASTGSEVRGHGSLVHWLPPPPQPTALPSHLYSTAFMLLDAFLGATSTLPHPICQLFSPPEIQVSEAHNLSSSGP